MTTDTLEAIQVQQTENSALPEIDFATVKFGHTFGDHMFVVDYADGQWKSPRIVPYGPLTFQPSISSLHYGQTVFEGMKAYRDASGQVNLFRPRDNFRRFNKSAERMAMPQVPEEYFMGALHKLLELDQGWVSGMEGHSLYIRPFMFATDEFIGVRPAHTYKFMIFTSPATVYYSEPIKLKVETHYARAAEGGTGFAKCGGNYGGALYPTKLVQDQGYHQLLWTDAKTHTSIEESGTMNAMFVIDDTLVTAPVSSTILDGVTRKSVLQLARDEGMQVEERPLPVEELRTALEEGRVNEAFGCGTAVTIGHFALIGFEDRDYHLPPLSERKYGEHLLKILTDIRVGRRPDPYGWVEKVKG